MKELKAPDTLTATWTTLEMCCFFSLAQYHVAIVCLPDEKRIRKRKEKADCSACQELYLCCFKQIKFPRKNSKFWNVTPNLYKIWFVRTSAKGLESGIFLLVHWVAKHDWHDSHVEYCHTEILLLNIMTGPRGMLFVFLKQQIVTFY